MSGKCRSAANKNQRYSETLRLNGCILERAPWLALHAAGRGPPSTSEDPRSLWSQLPPEGKALTRERLPHPGNQAKTWRNAHQQPHRRSPGGVAVARGWRTFQSRCPRPDASTARGCQCRCASPPPPQKSSHSHGQTALGSPRMGRASREQVSASRQEELQEGWGPRHGPASGGQARPCSPRPECRVSCPQTWACGASGPTWATAPTTRPVPPSEAATPLEGRGST